MVHAEELAESEEEAGPPREDGEGVEDEKEGERGDGEDGEGGVARGESTDLQSTVLVVSRVQQPSLERCEALQLGGHIPRRLALLLPRRDIRSSLNQPLDARRIALDRCPM